MKKNETPKPASAEWEKQLFYCQLKEFRVTGIDCDIYYFRGEDCPHPCPLRERHLSICKGIEQMSAADTPSGPAPAALGDLRIGVKKHGESDKFYYDTDGRPQMKICSRCQTPKGLDEYYKNKRARHGIGSICQTCDKAYYHSAAPAPKPANPETPVKAPAAPAVASKAFQKQETLGIESVIETGIESTPDSPEQLLESIYKAAGDRITRITVTFELAAV